MLIVLNNARQGTECPRHNVGIQFRIYIIPREISHKTDTPSSSNKHGNVLFLFALKTSLNINLIKSINQTL